MPFLFIIILNKEAPIDSLNHSSNATQSSQCSIICANLPSHLTNHHLHRGCYRRYGFYKLRSGDSDRTCHRKCVLGRVRDGTQGRSRNSIRKNFQVHKRDRAHHKLSHRCWIHMVRNQWLVRSDDVRTEAPNVSYTDRIKPSGCAVDVG